MNRITEFVVDSWKYDRTIFVIGGVLLGCVVALWFLISAIAKEEAAWELFAVEHECRIVAHKQGETNIGVGPTFGSGGGTTIITTSSSDQSAWLCDDGITYWRKSK